MITKKKIIALILSVVAICSFAGCGDKEETTTDQSNNKVISQEKESNGIVGVWVVESRENIRNTISDTMLEKMYPTGLEIEFTSDGKYIFDGIVIDYKILDDTTLEVERDFVEKLNYELSSDTLKIYYHGKDHAVIAKRK